MIWRGKVMDGYLQYVFSHSVLGEMKKKPESSTNRRIFPLHFGKPHQSRQSFSHKVKEVCNLLGGKKEKEECSRGISTASTGDLKRKKTKLATSGTKSMIMPSSSNATLNVFVLLRIVFFSSLSISNWPLLRKVLGLELAGCKAND